MLSSNEVFSSSVAAVAVAPADPMNLTIDAEFDGAQVTVSGSWDPVPGATSYTIKVYRNVGGVGEALVDSFTQPEAGFVRSWALNLSHNPFRYSVQANS